MLKDEFHSAMANIYKEALKLNYRANYFMQLVNAMGGVDAAKHWLAQTKYQSGFARLHKLGALHLSMENLVCKPAFSSLFTAIEIAEARRRLTEFEFDAEQHWLHH